jgi:YHS domain-containing protein
MKIRLSAILIAAFLVPLAATCAIAHCGSCGMSTSKAYAQEPSAETSIAGEPINDRCPVMGDKISKDTPYKMEYKGKVIGFCCSGCPATFKANPEKYEANLPELKKKDSKL